MKWIKHLATINHHRHLVMKHCFKVGLYKQGLLHDLSKYNPVEFLVGAKYYQGNRSPNNAEKEDKGYSKAWLHHKGRNKHHMEYWIDYSLNPLEGMVGMKMPDKYVVEMFCDRVAACKTYNKEKYTDQDPLNYFLKGKQKYILHPQVEELLQNMLEKLADEGEDNAFNYIRTNILKNK